MAKKNKKDGIYQFLSPEDADRIIIQRINSTPKKGGNRNGKWTPAELAIRDNVILEYICKQGLSRAECAKQISDRWQVCIDTAGRYIRDAFERLVQDNEKVKIDAREKQLERLENMLERAIEDGVYDAQLKILDQINKINGLYTEKKDIKIENDNITFKFGE